MVKVRPDQVWLDCALEQHRAWLEHDRKVSPARLDTPDQEVSGLEFGGASLRGASLEGWVFVCDRPSAPAPGEPGGKELPDDPTGRQASGVSSETFARGHLSGAELPPAITSAWEGKSPVWAYLNGLAKSAQTIFGLLLGVIAFGVLSIGSLSDEDLIFESGSWTLPILKVPVPPVAALFSLGVLIVVLFAYLHACLVRLARGYGVYPEIFPDGLSLAERSVPWIFLPLVEPRRASLPLAQRLGRFAAVSASVVSLWALAPLALGLVWARTITRHDALLSGVLAACTALVAAIAASSLVTCIDSLSLRPLKPRRYSVPLAAFITTIGVSGLLLGAASHGAFVGKTCANLPPWYLSTLGSETASFEDGEQAQPVCSSDWVPFAFETLGLKTHAVFGRLQLESGGSEKTGPGSESFQRVKPANCREWKLENLSGRRRFDFKFASLSGSDLSQRTDMSNQDFTGAFLRQADFSGSVLAQARFRGAHAERVRFAGAFLCSADFKGARLERATFESADLTGANLDGADLRGVDFRKAVLRGATLVGAHNLETIHSAKGAIARGVQATDEQKDILKEKGARL